MNNAIVFGDNLILASDARSAFAALGYGLMTGDVVILGLPENQKEALKEAYNDAFWGGEF